MKRVRLVVLSVHSLTYPREGISIDPDMTTLQISRNDFDRFDYIFAMDTSNLANIKRIQNNRGTKNGKAQVKLFGEYSGGKIEVVDDPYYSGGDAFNGTYEKCKRYSKNFLEATFPHIKPAA